jgi:DNA-directed RNA polymerase subunit RPC12/RpoP
MLEQIGRGERQYPLTVPSGPATPPGWRSLGALRPDLLEQLDPTRNREAERSGVDPSRLGTRSERTVWWKCRDCGDSWQGTVRDRVRGPGCPACYERVVRERSLAVLRPDLLAEWDERRNVGLRSDTVGVWSDRKVWWLCGECGHEWRTDVKHRAQRGQGCPECGRRRSTEFSAGVGRWRVPRERSFAVLRPDLLSEWNAERNGGLDPFAIGTGSSQSVWWRCGRCGHEWRARPSHRCEGSGCPSCAGRHLPRERSLGALRPEWLADWHPDRNGDLDPFTIAPRSGRVPIWWRCRYRGHEWQTTTLRRGHSIGGCRSCARRHPSSTERPEGRQAPSQA